MLNVYSILADEEVRQGLKVWVSHEQNDVEVTANVGSPIGPRSHSCTSKANWSAGLTL